MLANGSGAVDWSGLPLAVALYGISDLEGLVLRLQVIKHHKPPQGT